MKRNHLGVPVGTVQRWSQPPVSCQLCRTKKLRCDRAQRCSNCVLRNTQCTYPGMSSTLATAPETGSAPHPTAPARFLAFDRPTDAPADCRRSSDLGNVFQRLKRLESAVFNSNENRSESTPLWSSSLELVRRDHDVPTTTDTSGWLEGLATTPNSTLVSSDSDSPNSLHVFSRLVSAAAPQTTTSRIRDKLPAKQQAMDLFEHFVKNVDCNYRVLHVPSARMLVEQTYQRLFEGEEPDLTVLLLLFSIFASGSFFSTKSLRVRDGFNHFSRIAVSLVEQGPPTIQPSVTALQAISILTHLFTNCDGFSITFHLLRNAGLHMAQTLRIHQLDTTSSCQERKFKGANPVDVEIQRRLWWHIVSSDW